MRLTQKRIISALLVTVIVLLTVTVGFFVALPAKYQKHIHMIYALEQSGIDPSCLNKIIDEIDAENKAYLATNPKVVETDKFTFQKDALLHYYKLAKCVYNNISSATAQALVVQYYDAPPMATEHIFPMLSKYQKVKFDKLEIAGMQGSLDILQLFEGLGRMQSGDASLLADGFYNIMRFVAADEEGLERSLTAIDNIIKFGIFGILGYKDLLRGINYFGGAVGQINNMQQTLRAFQKLQPITPDYVVGGAYTITQVADAAKNLTMADVLYAVQDITAKEPIGPTVVNISKLLIEDPAIGANPAQIGKELNPVFEALSYADPKYNGDFLVQNVQYFATKDAKNMSAEDKRLAEEFYQIFQSIFKAP